MTKDIQRASIRPLSRGKWQSSIYQSTMNQSIRHPDASSPPVSNLSSTGSVEGAKNSSNRKLPHGSGILVLRKVKPPPLSHFGKDMSLSRLSQKYRMPMLT
jgi:hypothetical protein